MVSSGEGPGGYMCIHTFELQPTVIGLACLCVYVFVCFINVKFVNKNIVDDNL